MGKKRVSISDDAYRYIVAYKKKLVEERNRNPRMIRKKPKYMDIAYTLDKIIMERKYGK